MPSSVGSRPGLRELKKARTIEAIQGHAVRMFLDGGYDATTVEAIAAAAEVAPSTVYRYFPTKEDLVTSDEFDVSFLDNFRAQPAELGVIQALRVSIREVIAEVSADFLAVGWQRNKLMLSEPSLRGATLGSLLELHRIIAEVVATRTGRGPDDLEVGRFTGAVIGIALDLMQRWVDDPKLDILGVFEQALDQLEHGFQL